MVNKTTKKMLIVLTATCLCASLALSLVFVMTKDKIAYQQKLKIERAIKAILPENDEKEVKIVELSVCKSKEKTDENKECKTIYIAKAQKDVLTMATQVIVKGYGGKISAIIGVGEDDKLTGLKIVKHNETPGLGANITKKTFEKQFVKKDNALKLKKEGGDIDQVTGATISSKAVIKSAKDGLEFIFKNKEFIKSKIKENESV